MEYKRKITAFLAAVLLCSGIAFAYLAQSGTGENTKALPGKSVSSSNSLPNLTVGSNDNLNTGGLFFKMMLMVLLVVALGAAAVYLSKKLLPKLNLPGKRIQVSETVHLGPRKAIHLIKIGKQTLLIGSTNENITKLADVTDLSEENLPVNQKEDN
ncbi:MAG: flagellar biosynthetic protein FliO [Sedimentisphaerales bacterium]|jgi:flagellar biosynthetic protein FliO